MRLTDVDILREIDIEKYFNDATILASVKGWAILWADHSFLCVDIVDTPENNFNRAYEVYRKVEGK